MTAPTDQQSQSKLAKARRFAGMFVRHRRTLWGVPGLRASYVFFAVYALLVISAVTREPVVAGAAMAAGAVVEASDILPANRRRRRLSDWRRGLDVRTQWRTLLFFTALAAGSVAYPLLAAYGVFALTTAFAGRVMRSPALHLDSDRVLRPMGALRAGAERLAKARSLARRRDLSEMPLNFALGFAALFLTLPSESDITVGGATVIAAVFVALAVGYACVTALSCRRLRPVLKLQHDAEVLAEFLAYEPEVLCYFNGHRGSTYAVNVWLRTFEACAKRVALVYRHDDVRSVDTDRLPGIVARSDAMIEKLVSPATKIALYPANGTMNIHLQRDSRLAHVFIGHGDSDKSGSASPYTKSYDQVWVSGPAGVERYAAAGVAIPQDRFVIIGRPPIAPAVRARAIEYDLEETGSQTGPTPREALVAELAEHDADGQPPTILYAPTWEGYFDESDYNSLAEMGVEIVTRILDTLPGTRVVFKPHPLTGHRVKENLRVVGAIRSLLDADEGAHHPSTVTHRRIHLYEWFDRTDLLITDVSSVLTDFMAWDKPYAVTNPLNLSVEDLHAGFPTTAAAYVLDRDSPATARTLGAALRQDPLRARRDEARRYFLGDPERDPLDLFNEALDTLYRSID